MIKITLYTEDLGNLGQLASKHFESFTLTQAIGFWKGVAEKSVKIEIIGELEGIERSNILIADIKRTNKQEAVLREVTEINARLF